MRILVVGAGYVGLTTAAVMSTQHQVTVVESNPFKVELINKGIAPFAEKGMSQILHKSVNDGSLRAVFPDNLPSKMDFVIICVGTPPRLDGSVDLTYLSSAMDNLFASIDSIVDEYCVFVLKSTVPPGTTRLRVLNSIRERGLDEKIGVVFNPEFMKQGFAVDDISNPDRVVIGSSNEKASSDFEKLYRSIIKHQETPFFKMSMESAELCKYASNCFLASKVSFTNELASLSERIKESNIEDVMKAVTADTRISPSHLKPGLGFGGTCLPKDLEGLIHYGNDLGVQMKLLEAVKIVNDSTAKRLLRLLVGRVEDLRGAKVAVLGISFKKGTDDTRSSQSLDLIEELHAHGVNIYVHDPLANESTIEPNIRSMFERCETIEECTNQAEALFLMTDWPIYEEIGLENLVKNMNAKVVIDGRRVFSKLTIPEYIQYISLGSCPIIKEAKAVRETQK